MGWCSSESWTTTLCRTTRQQRVPHTHRAAGTSGCLAVCLSLTSAWLSRDHRTFARQGSRSFLPCTRVPASCSPMPGMPAPPASSSRSAFQRVRRSGEVARASPSLASRGVCYTLPAANEDMSAHGGDGCLCKLANPVGRIEAGIAGPPTDRWRPLLGGARSRSAWLLPTPPGMGVMVECTVGGDRDPAA
jgi:hypothetical protein